MRRTAVTAALALAALAIGSGPALAGTPTGNGAQRSALSPASNGGGSSSCSQGDRTASDGWAMLNKTAAPVTGTSMVQGEVHIVDPALAGQTVTAYVVPSNSSSCMSMVMAPVHINMVGIGNGHLAGSESSGSYYVAILQGTNEVLASQAVTLQ